MKDEWFVSLRFWVLSCPRGANCSFVDLARSAARRKLSRHLCVVLFRDAEMLVLAVAASLLHRGKAFVGIDSTRFSFGCLYYGVNSLADSVAHTVEEAHQQLLFVGAKHDGGIFCQLLSAAGIYERRASNDVLLLVPYGTCEIVEARTNFVCLPEFPKMEVLPIWIFTKFDGRASRL